MARDKGKLGVRRDRLVLVTYSPEWSGTYRREASLIRKTLGRQFIDLEHIGSTAVPGTVTKPIIDILGMVKNLKGMARHRRKIESIGYTWKGAAGLRGRRYFTRNSEDDRVCFFHLHCYQADDIEIERYLLFRDYLRKHPKAVEEYNRVKRQLKRKFKHDRLSYTEGKTKFITGIVEKAKVSDGFAR